MVAWSKYIRISIWKRLNWYWIIEMEWRDTPSNSRLWILLLENLCIYPPPHPTIIRLFSSDSESIFLFRPESMFLIFLSNKRNNAHLYDWRPPPRTQVVWEGQSMEVVRSCACMLTGGDVKVCSLYEGCSLTPSSENSASTCVALCLRIWPIHPPTS